MWQFNQAKDARQYHRIYQAKLHRYFLIEYRTIFMAVTGNIGIWNALLYTKENRSRNYLLLYVESHVCKSCPIPPRAEIDFVLFFLFRFSYGGEWWLTVKNNIRRKTNFFMNGSITVQNCQIWYSNSSNVFREFPLLTTISFSLLLNIFVWFHRRNYHKNHISVRLLSRMNCNLFFY